MNYDMLTTQEKRQTMPFASQYLMEELAKQEYTRKRIRKYALARAQTEAEYEPEGELE